MVSKKKAFIGAVILVLLTAVVTLTLGNYIALRVGESYLISDDHMEYYQEMEEEYSKLNYMSEFLLENYYQELDEEALMEGAVRGVFEATEDPYTTYMSADEYEDFTSETEGSFGGIGIIVTPGDDGYVTVVSPIEGTPGFRAGIETGDKIIEVDGQEVQGPDLNKAVDLMRGEPGTEVEVSIRREDEQELIELTIVREMIKIETIHYEMLEDDIGYIRITNFNQQTAGDFEEALNALVEDDMQALVLDLRNNPGGLLSQTIEIGDMILGEQVIVYTEDRDGNRREETSSADHVDVPLTVLVNKGSASASEILAGAVQDGDRGTIIGQTTFGKALVQGIREYPEDGSGFRYTVAEYFTPNGNFIQDEGIEPDILVEMEGPVSVELIEEGEDLQLQRGIEVLKEELDRE